MEKKAGGKRKRSGEGSGSVASKRGNGGRRTKVQQLWSRLPYGVLLECFQSLDVRNARRITRVSRNWKSSLWNLPVHNKGVLFLSWYKDGGENLVEGSSMSHTDMLLKKNAEPVYDPDSYSWTIMQHAPMDQITLPLLFGADLQHVKHLVCGGRGFKEKDPMLKFTGWSEPGSQVSLLKKEPNCQMSKFTLYKKQFSESFDYIGRMMKFAASFSQTPNIDLMGSNFSFKVGLKGIWSEHIILAYDVECVLKKVSLRIPFDRSGRAWNDEGFSGGPSWFFNWYHRWIYEGLRDNNTLWHYPEKQAEWFRTCLDMVPACEDTATVGGRAGLKCDLDRSEDWMKKMKLDGIIPKTGLYFDGYQLDKLECEILAQWFQLTNKRFIKKRLASPANSYLPHPEFPTFPEPPFGLTGIATLRPQTCW